MRKPFLVALLCAAGAMTTQLGCRACSSCLDYGSPVAGAACGGCHDCRSGSCFAGSPTETPTVASQPGATNLKR